MESNGTHQQWTHGDYLNDAGMAGLGECAEPDNTNQRPLQLPRVGWGDDGDNENDNDSDSTGSGNNHEQSPNNNSMAPDAIVSHVPAESGIIQRPLSRTSEAELASIPEDMSMHGTWPDYYPDIFGSCYDYDEDRKKYAYNRWGPHFKQRCCALVLILICAVIGSRVFSNMMAGKPNAQHHNNLPQSSDSDIDLDIGSKSSPSPQHADAKEESDKNQNEPTDEDIYQVVVDTMDPIMLDDTFSEWDGTYFHAYEFCGTKYSRVPCPYIAYCPLGPGHAPLGGTKIEHGGSWAPILNEHRESDWVPDWVQLGRGNHTCELYSEINKGSEPPWGNVVGGGDAGSQQEDISRHVMCCRETVGGEYSGEVEVMNNNPDLINRPPALEEDEMAKPIPIHDEDDDNGGGNRRRLK